MTWFIVLRDNSHFMVRLHFEKGPDLNFFCWRTVQETQDTADKIHSVSCQTGAVPTDPVLQMLKLRPAIQIGKES